MKILFADDETSLQELMRLELPLAGHTVTVCGDGNSAIAAIETDNFDCLLVDLNMPGAGGMEVIDFARRRAPETDAVILTGKGTLDTAIAAMRQGVYDYLRKPCKLADIQKILAQIEEKRHLKRKLLAAESRLKRLDKGTKLIGRSPAMQQVQRIIDRVAPSDSTVLIRGETGTGKELVAKAVHDRSKRATMPFVAVNCGALPETLIESELFGHRKGSFTGAEANRTGLFEVAHKGTLFLDEIGELPKGVQAKLLRFLESGEVRRIGENSANVCDVRVVCATHRNLEVMSENGDFREDLLFRINTFEIYLPPLREHLDDLSELIEHIAKRFLPSNVFTSLANHRVLAPSVSAGVNESPALFTAAAIQVLRQYPWPGNVRQLVNVIEHAVILSDTLPIDIDSLPQPVLRAAGITTVPIHSPVVSPVVAQNSVPANSSVISPFSTADSPVSPVLPMSGAVSAEKDDAMTELLSFETGFTEWGADSLAGKTLKDLETVAIQESLTRHGGNKSKVAEELGISLKTLYNKLNQTTDTKRAG